MIVDKEAIVAKWNDETVYLQRASVLSEESYIIHLTKKDFRDGEAVAVLADDEIRSFGQKIGSGDEIEFMGTITLERDCLEAITNASKAVAIRNVLSKL